MIIFDHVSKVYPNGTVGLDDVDLTIQDGEFVAIIGRSGAGKSTLLRSVNRMHQITSGTLTVNGTDVSTLSGKSLRRFRRGIGMVFQSFNLVTRTTVIKNVLSACVPDMPFWRVLLGAFRKADKIKALESLDKVGILDKAYIRADQLSGGQQQRVALARILCSQPEVILLDEPFSALDSYLKWDLELKLSDFLENFSGPILWVSHDRGEVFRNCKRVCILDQGASQGTFTLRQLFHEPETEAAARLSGCKNIVEAVPAGSAVTLPAWGLTLNCGKPVPADVRQAGIRARHVMTVPEGTPDAFYCTVERVIQDVFTTIVLLRPEGAADGAPLLRMELERDDWRRLNRPEGLWIAVQPRDVLLLK